MSGHSKWSTIKRQKGAADVKRGQAFTKISNAITIAVKQGGGVSDPDSNPRLRIAIDAARKVNMPKDNIERVIQRAQHKGEGGVEEVVYEGFIPGGAGVIVEAVTDNPNRTTSEIKNLFGKFGASLARPGAVSYQFANVGEITVLKNTKSMDEMLMIAADAGAEDVSEDSEAFTIYTNPHELTKVKESLEKQGISVEEAFLSKKAVTNISLDPGKEEGIINFLQSLENLDDVQKVYTNIS
ncbi:MAG: transcriptional regulator [Candidatus Levybacteria bacterium GW2011_GWA2_40_8]|nr:MAG: transcriptional regulator [Candidatus Levybacteria bacterium GW2011_GWA2_40_8]